MWSARTASENSGAVSMICKEDIYGWFRDSVSSQRIDLMCGLLQLCLPLELRFVGSCLEDKARRDYCRLREYDMKANDQSMYLALMSELAVAQTVDSLHRMLSVYLSLLRSNNATCALRLYEMLMLLWDRVRSVASVPIAVNKSSVDPESGMDSATKSLPACGIHSVADLTLLFTMASYHPAFTFSQRIQLYQALTNLQNLHHDGNKYSDAKEKMSSSKSDKLSHTPSYVLCNGTIDVACQTSSPVYPVDVELKRESKNHFYLLTINWSDGSHTEVTKSLRQLRDFHGELVKHFAKMMTDIGQVEASCQLPRFPYDKTLTSIPRQMIEAMRNSFRELLKLPHSLHKESAITRIFQEFADLHDLVSNTSCDVHHSTERTQLTSSQSASNLCVANSSEWQSCSPGTLPFAVQSVHVSQLPRSPEPGSGVLSSKSSPLLSTHRSSGGSRSRHNSPRGGDSVVAWLKEIRLHKYTDSLSKFSFEELKQLNDDDLQQLGLTSGACKKFLTEMAIRHKNDRHLLDDPSYSDQRSKPTSYTRSSLVASPVNIDSSCSEYSTPPGSPPLDQRNHFHSVTCKPSMQTHHSAATNQMASVDSGRENDILSWSTGYSTRQPSGANSAGPVDISPHVDVAHISNSPAYIETSASNASDMSHRYIQVWQNSDESQQASSTMPVSSQQFSVHYMSNIPMSGLFSVGHMENLGNFEIYEASKRPSEYPTIVSLPSQAMPPPEVQSSAAIVQSLPPMQPHIPPGAIPVRPRLGLIAGHAIRFQEAATSPMNSGPPLLLFPPPMVADPSTPSSQYISVNNHDNATGNVDVYGRSYLVPPCLPSPPLMHGLEEENSVANAPTFCEQCGQSISVAGITQNFGCPPPAWPAGHFIPVFPPPTPVAMPTCFTVATSSLLARPPLSHNAAVSHLPGPYRLASPGVFPEMFMQSVLHPPPLSGHVSSMGVVNAAHVNMPPIMASGAQARAGRSPQHLCSNCGMIGHTYAECKEPTVEAVLNTGQFCLEVATTESN